MSSSASPDPYNASPRIPNIAVRKRVDSDRAGARTPKPDAAPTEFQQWRKQQSIDLGAKVSNTRSPVPSIQGTEASSGSSGNASNTRKNRGILAFFSVKEPSAAAWQDYGKQQRTQAAARGILLSTRSLPAHVPKVNSKWDGMPSNGINRMPSSDASWSQDSQARPPSDQQTESRHSLHDRRGSAVSSESAVAAGAVAAAQSSRSTTSAHTPSISQPKSPLPGASLSRELSNNSSLDMPFTSNDSESLPDWPRRRSVRSSVDSGAESSYSLELTSSMSSDGTYEDSQDRFPRPSVECLLASRAASGKFAPFAQVNDASGSRVAGATTAARMTPTSVVSHSPRSTSRPTTPREISSNTSFLEDGQSPPTVWYSSEDEREGMSPQRSRESPSENRANSTHSQSASREALATSIRSSPTAAPSFSRPLYLARATTGGSPPSAVEPLLESYTGAGLDDADADHFLGKYASPVNAFIPPRFQPGCVRVKDSDLDTIAETDSNYTSSRRQSRVTVGSDEDTPPGTPSAALFIPSAYYKGDLASLRTSASFSESGTSVNEEDYDDDDESDSRTETDDTDHTLSFDPDFAQRRSYLGEADEISIAESQVSTASHMSDSWYKSPRERLGLGGFIRRSTRDSPWLDDGEELGPVTRTMSRNSLRLTRSPTPTSVFDEFGTGSDPSGRYRDDRNSSGNLPTRKTFLSVLKKAAK